MNGSLQIPIGHGFLGYMGSDCRIAEWTNRHPPTGLQRPAGFVLVPVLVSAH